MDPTKEEKEAIQLTLDNISLLDGELEEESLYTNSVVLDASEPFEEPDVPLI